MKKQFVFVVVAAIVHSLAAMPVFGQSGGDLKQTVDALVKLNQKADRIDSKVAGLGNRISALENKAYSPPPYQPGTDSWRAKYPEVPAYGVGYRPYDGPPVGRPYGYPPAISCTMCHTR